MREIYCPVGEIQTSLPKEAWTDESGLDEVAIEACDGCQHTGHSNFLRGLEHERGFAEDMEVKHHEVGSLTHYVSVGKNADGTPDVYCYCSCNRHVRYPDVDEELSRLKEEK